FLLRRRLASKRSASLGAAFVAVNLVAVCTRVIQFLADVDEAFVIPRLGGSPRQLSNFDEFVNVLFPVRAIDGHRPAVLTSASRAQEQRCGFGNCNRCLIDSQPSRVNSRSPFDIIKRRRRGLLFRLGGRILELDVEYDVGIWKSDRSHQLGKVSFWPCSSTGRRSHGSKRNLR